LAIPVPPANFPSVAARIGSTSSGLSIAADHQPPSAYFADAVPSGFGIPFPVDSGVPGPIVYR
jgi:hypothetical protein